jgi:hypothetical protein
MLHSGLFPFPSVPTMPTAANGSKSKQYTFLFHYAHIFHYEKSNDVPKK